MMAAAHVSELTHLPIFLIKKTTVEDVQCAVLDFQTCQSGLRKKKEEKANKISEDKNMKIKNKTNTHDQASN